MASRAEVVPINGRVDRDGRLVAADAALERLQVEAGSALGRALALPQIAALARAAASLGVALARSVVAADRHHDLDLYVRAEPTGDDVLLTIERWVARPMAAPRLTAVDGLTEDGSPAADRSSYEFDVDAGLALTDLSPALAALLGVEQGAALGRPLTGLFRLLEEADGTMPLLAGVANRSAVAAQRAEPRMAPGQELKIDADPEFDDAGTFVGFHARVRREGEHGPSNDDQPMFEDSLDEALRSPLARIISAADHIVERGDGPLRSDYANYASDIAAAGRHLLSVIRAMGQSNAPAARSIDLDLLAREAVGLVQPMADPRGIEIAVGEVDASCPVAGEAHAVIQILVNVLGNAVRHSPDGGRIAVAFEQDSSGARVTIADEGPGIAAADQERIFARYERVGSAPDGSGLGLAIARRLARSMGGDITLDSTPGEGARFTLVLPAA